MKFFILNDNHEIPALGFGTWKLAGKACLKSVETALEVGYRHIDTADVYGNHKEIGLAIRNSGVKRDDLFITTKVWRTALAKEDVISSAERFLAELNLEYIDLLLIHWPNKNIPIQDTMEGFADLKERGIINSIGVSNFTTHHLQDVLGTGVKIVNNQVEFHPSFSQAALRNFCDANKILLTAYSPLGQGRDLKLPAIVELAQKYQKSCSQIIISWLLSKGIVAIPKSSDPKYIKENFEAMDFEMKLEDCERIDSLDINKRLLDTAFGEFNY